MIVIFLPRNLIAGGKRSETMTGTSGRIERVWDVYPYPNETEIDIVLADITAVTMATASPEIKNSKFYKDAEAPLLWYFTQCSIADQREILVKIILPHACNVLGRKVVRNERRFLAGSTSSDKLTKTYLDKYLWYILNVQSTIPDRPEDKIPAYSLSPTNRILQKVIGRTEQAESPCLTQPGDKPQARGLHQDGGRPAKRGRPGS